jgi:hypothetical protein
MSFALDRPHAALYSLKKKRDEETEKENGEEKEDISLRKDNGVAMKESAKKMEEDNVLDAELEVELEMEDEIRLLSERDIREQTSEEQCARRNFGDVPWRRVLSHRCIWVILTCQFANNYSALIFNSWIPTFLKRTLGFDLRETGFISVLPYILQGTSLIFLFYFFFIFSTWT